jgi:hypothetical protein
MSASLLGQTSQVTWNGTFTSLPPGLTNPNFTMAFNGSTLSVMITPQGGDGTSEIFSITPTQYPGWAAFFAFPPLPMGAALTGYYAAFFNAQFAWGNFVPAGSSAAYPFTMQIA